jgi:hypothetical protein
MDLYRLRADSPTRCAARRSARGRVQPPPFGAAISATRSSVSVPRSRCASCGCSITERRCSSAISSTARASDSLPVQTSHASTHQRSSVESRSGTSSLRRWRRPPPDHCRRRRERLHIAVGRLGGDDEGGGGRGGIWFLCGGAPWAPRVRSEAAGALEPVAWGSSRSATVIARLRRASNAGIVGTRARRSGHDDMRCARRGILGREGGWSSACTCW